MKKRILSLLLAFLMLFSLFPTHSTYAAETENEVTVWYFNSATESLEQAETVELYRGGELYLSAVLREDISGNIQWQIEAEQDFWVDIQGGTAEDLRVSYGMVQSLLVDNAVRMRCTVSGDAESSSDPFTIVVTDVDNRLTADTYNIERTPVAPDPLPAPIGVPNESEPVVAEEAEPASTEEAEPASTEEAEPTSTEETEPTATEETEPVSTEEPVTIVDNDVPLASSSTAGIMLLSAVNTTSTDTQNEDITYYTVTIEYVYGNNSKFAGQRVALPYIAEVATGGTLSETVASPSCVGYTPNITSINLADLGNITGNVTRTVEYSPAEVSYTVRHYLQNVDDDEYSWVDTTMSTGYTEALTSDNAAKTYTGFTALSHYHEEIAADSSTMIDIYYDRNYYLMSFDLDGGYGVAAIYARYGASVSVSDPQRAGYSFKGWSLDGTTQTTLPATMPSYNSSYTALWNAGNTSYTIAYWLENADADNKYDFVGSVSASANSGDSVSGSDSAVANGVFTSDEWQYYAYNSDKTDADVTVAGDGSTVVNVYYDRNEYTLKFYYARSYVSDGTTRYEISHSNDEYKEAGQDVDKASWNDTKENVKPILSEDYEEKTGTIGNDTEHTYYYFELKVKYGQDLSLIWPDAPITNATDTTTFGRSFVSWGTQPGSGYYGKGNIKGPYSLMDSNLVVTVNNTMLDEHHLVAYYGTPTMFNIEIFYETVGTEDENSAKETVDGVEYTLWKSTAYGAQQNSVANLVPLSFPGVQYVSREDDVENKTTKWFYSRNRHTVTLDDNYGNANTYTIPYGGTISSYITDIPEPNYPVDLPVGAYEFGGWYQSKEGIGELDTSITMPNEDLIYYALWTPKAYTVTINDGNGTVLFTEQVNYGSKATKPTDPTMENATFIGWYYKDANNTEQRFDFDNMTITQDMTIYAKWRSEVMKQVEIYYVVENEDGTQAQIADTETLMLRLGQTRTFEAKTGVSLYEAYRNGCFPTTATHSITPTDADLDSEDPITYTFVYKQYGAVPYQVEFYVEKDGVRWPAFRQVTQNGETKAEFVEAGQWSESDTEYIEQHWQNDKAVVTELYVPDSLVDSTWVLPDEYLPNALKLQKIIVPSSTDPQMDIEANTIVFIYTYTEPDDPDTPVYDARYLVQHYIQNPSDITQYDLYSYSDETGLSGETASASPISIPGYTYSYDATNTNKQDGTTLTQGADGAVDVMSGTITADDKLELNFYYSVNSYPYQVLYLEESTNRVLASAKTTGSDGVTLSGLYGSTVTETAIEIDGYDVVGASTKTIYIQMEAGDTASVNTIVFYYKLKSAELVLTKTVALDETQAEQEGISTIPSWVYDQEFVFTVHRPEGFPKSVYHYTFTDVNNQSEERTVNAGVQTIEVSLKSGESIRFHDFPMGTYTVTETYVPGFRTSVDGYIAQTHTVTLDSDGDIKTLDFLNTFPFYTGDLVIKKNVTKLDADDPTATDPYKVTIVLEPDDSAREVDRVITWTNAGATEESTFTVPALSETYTDKIFTIEALVPVGGEVKLEGVPVGDFTVTEEIKGTVGYIYDYYTVKYNKAVHENDEVTGTNHVISSCIHGGHPTAVTLNNIYKKGSLTIKKTVTQEYANDSWNGDTFSFSITGTTELPDGTYSVEGATVTVENGNVTVKGTDGEDLTITIAKTDDPKAWSGSLTFKNLPAGYYTVTETAALGNDKYDAVGPEDSLLVNDTDNATEFTFTNTYKRTTGSLQVGKEIVIVTEGSIIDTEQEFTFVVKPKDSTLAGSYDCAVKYTDSNADVADSATSLTVRDGVLTFTLKHNQYILIEGLPVGKYRVQEKAIEGYASSFSSVITTGGTDYYVDPATITTNNTTVLNCENAYPVYYAHLVVRKTVVTPSDHSAVDQAPVDDEFTFTVNISNYSDKISLEGGIGAKFYGSADDTPTTEKSLTVTNNTVTFTLKHGEWVDLNLPTCTYTVEETGLTSSVNTTGSLTDHYIVSSAFITSEDSDSNYTLIAGETETLAFTNEYKRHYMDLTINTVCADAAQSFLFDVSATDTALGNIQLQVVLVGNDSQTIKDLPIGTYTVTEQNNWSWRENAVASTSVTLQTESVTVPFDFETVDRIYWLSGYSYNIRKKGGS